MNTKRLVKELKEKYPGKEIILNPPDHPHEIIIELEPTRDHPEKSLALAIVGRSQPHLHRKTTEIYEAVKGVLTVYVEGEKHVLQEGERVTIKPQQIHSAEGNEAWFLTHSRPGWTAADHIVVENG